MLHEMIVRIKIISRPLSYWQTSDPIVPLGQGAHVIGQDSSIVKVGDGTKKYSQLSDTHIDSFVASHAAIHSSTGRDPLIATDAENAAGTSIIKAPNVRHVKAAITAHANTAATVAVVGHVKLNNTINDISVVEAATANAVKLAYDRGTVGINTATTADGKAVAAQTTANTAVTNAASAQTKANTAQANIDALGRHTISTGAPSGTSKHGDIWWQYF